MPAKFSIILQRGPLNNPATDETISLVQIPNGRFLVNFKSNVDNIWQTTNMDWDEAYWYLKDTLTLIAADKEPFTAIQFNFPLVPSIILFPCDLIDFTKRASLLRRINVFLRSFAFSSTLQSN